jgi:hypothetical protein
VLKARVTIQGIPRLILPGGSRRRRTQFVTSFSKFEVSIMALFVMLLAIALVGVVAAVVPFLLPWPQHMRWMIATSGIAYPFESGGLAGSLFLREVTVAAIDTESDQLVVWLATASNGALLVRSCPPSAESACQLEQWAVAGMPLLLVSTNDGNQSLYSPSACVLGLRDRAEGPQLKAA